MKKRLIALVLALVLSMSFAVAALAESDFKSFDTMLLKGVKQTVSNWYATEETRALLTVLALVEYSVNVEELEVDWLENSYVGYYDDFLVISAPTADDRYVIFTFDAENPETLDYMFTATGTSEDAVISMYKDVCTGYKANTLDAILSATEELAAIVAGE